MKGWDQDNHAQRTGRQKTQAFDLVIGHDIDGDPTEDGRCYIIWMPFNEGCFRNQFLLVSGDPSMALAAIRPATTAVELLPSPLIQVRV